MIVLDIEATGTNYQKHSILSIGALDFNNPENRIYLECHAWEGAHIDPEAIKVCGFTEEEATDKTKQTEAQIVGQFITWAEGIEDQTFLGQNVSFDRDYIKAACERAGYNYPFAHRTVDTHSLAYMHHILHGREVPIEKRHSALNIEAIAEYLGMPPEPEPHNALTGALYHAEMAYRLLYGKKYLEEFKNSEIPVFD
jgi:DNA polymerase III epsilon subunit-like protein